MLSRGSVMCLPVQWVCSTEAADSRTQPWPPRQPRHNALISSGLSVFPTSIREKKVSVQSRCDTMLLHRLGPNLGQSTKYNTAVHQQWVFRVESCLWLHHGFLGPNPVSSCVADFQSQLLITVPNAFSDSSFINLVCTHTVFERATDTIHPELLLTVGVIRWNKVA